MKYVKLILLMTMLFMGNAQAMVYAGTEGTLLLELILRRVVYINHYTVCALAKVDKVTQKLVLDTAQNRKQVLLENSCGGKSALFNHKLFMHVHKYGTACGFLGNYITQYGGSFRGSNVPTTKLDLCYVTMIDNEGVHREQKTIGSYLETVPEGFTYDPLIVSLKLCGEKPTLLEYKVYDQANDEVRLMIHKPIVNEAGEIATFVRDESTSPISEGKYYISKDGVVGYKDHTSALFV